MQIFSRGFTGGMYGGRAGRGYVTRTHPDNRGAVLGRVIGRTGGELLVSLTRPLSAGDGIGLEHPDGAARGNSGFSVTRVRTLNQTEGLITQAIATAADVPAGWVVVRSSQPSLLEAARESFATVVPPREGVIQLHVARRAAPAVRSRWSGTTEPRRSPLQASPRSAPRRKHALDVTRLREQLGRLAETPYVLGPLDVNGLEQGLFLPLSALNDLRQEAVASLLAAHDRESEEQRTVRQIAIDDALAVVSHPALPLGNAAGAHG